MIRSVTNKMQQVATRRSAENSEQLACDSVNTSLHDDLHKQFPLLRPSCEAHPGNEGVGWRRAAWNVDPINLGRHSGYFALVLRRGYSLINCLSFPQSINFLAPHSHWISKLKGVWPPFCTHFASHIGLSAGQAHRNAVA